MVGIGKNQVSCSSLNQGSLALLPFCRFLLQPQSSTPDSNNQLVDKLNHLSYNWGWSENLQEGKLSRDRVGKTWPKPIDVTLSCVNPNAVIEIRPRSEIKKIAHPHLNRHRRPLHTHMIKHRHKLRFTGGKALANVNLAVCNTQMEKTAVNLFL
jgi:hypothetical protein